MNIRNGLEMITPETYGFIYMTHNMVNGKKYIGQKRIASQYPWQNYLGSGKTLIKAIDKYGRDNFYKDIIDVCSNQEELDRREQYWIQYYDAVKSDMFYNISAGGAGSNFWGGASEEEKRLFSEKEYASSLKGEDSPLALMTNAQAEEIIRLLLLGHTTREVADEVGVSRRSVMRIRQKEKWKHLTVGIEFPEVNYSHAGSTRKKKKPVQHVKHIKKKKNKDKHVYVPSPDLEKPIVQYDLFGNYIERYDNIDDVVNKFGKEKRAGIIKTCRHKNNCAFGSLWFFEDDLSIPNYLRDDKWLERCRKFTAQWNRRKVAHKEHLAVKPIIQYDLNMNYIQTFESMGDAAKSVNASIAHLSRALKNNNKFKGFIWIKK